jgi:hypothetical protein
MSADTFRLTINLGNAAMGTTDDVAEALENLAERLRKDGRSRPKIDSGHIRDINGNTVGEWEFR